MKETPELFKYLDGSKVDFFEKKFLLLAPPNHLNDPWDFLPKATAPSQSEILNVWQENENDLTHSPTTFPPIRGKASRRFPGLSDGLNRLN